MGYYSDDETEKRLKELEKVIAKEYTDASKEMKKKADEYFAKLNNDRYWEQYEAYQNGVYTKAEFDLWYKTQVQRGEGYHEMADELAQRAVDANKVAEALINDTTPGIYSLNYNYEAYRINQAYGVNFHAYDEQTVKGLLLGDNHIEFKTVKVNPVRDYDWNSKQINKALLSGILQGKTIDELSSSYMGVMGRNRDAAIRNARTSVTSAQNAGRLESYGRAEEMGISLEKEWMATLDSRTRDSHADLDGEVKPNNKAFSNGLMYPGDPNGSPREVYNCRCTMRAILPGINDKKKPDRAYKVKDGDKEHREYGTDGNAKVLKGYTYTGANGGKSFVKWLNKNKIVNAARAIDSFHTDNIPYQRYKKQEILKELSTTPVGKDTIRFINNDEYVNINIINSPVETRDRGSQVGARIELYAQNNKDLMECAKTVIHDVAHYRYGIGECQHAEAVCFAMEKMHIMGRDFLYPEEWEYVKQLAIDNYPKYEWEAGGYGDYDQFNFVRYKN